MRTEYFIELDDWGPDPTPPPLHRPGQAPPAAGRAFAPGGSDDGAAPTPGAPGAAEAGSSTRAETTRPDSLTRQAQPRLPAAAPLPTRPHTPAPEARAGQPAGDDGRLDPARLAALSAAVLQLHRGCRDWPAMHFDARAMELVAGVLPHSACLWGSTAQDAAPGAPPSVQGLFSQGLDAATVGALLAGQGPAPGLQMQQLEPLAGRRVLVQLWRSASQGAFDDADRQALAFLMPHLVEAQRENRLEQARHATAGPRPRRSLLLCDETGHLQQVDEHGLALLRQEWPRWLGRTLPPPLVAALQQALLRAASGTGGAAGLAGTDAADGHAPGPDEPPDGPAGAQAPQPACYGRVVTVLLARSGGLLLLDVRRRTAVDRLSQRQRDIARRYAGGQSGPQIATALGLSSSTVNNHLGVIFKRLGVGSKLQLSEMLRGEGDPRGLQA